MLSKPRSFLSFRADTATVYDALQQEQQHQKKGIMEGRGGGRNRDFKPNFSYSLLNEDFLYKIEIKR